MVFGAALVLTVSAAGQMRNPPPASINSVGGSTLGGPPASIYSLPAQPQPFTSRACCFVGGKIGFGHNPRFTVFGGARTKFRHHRRSRVIIPAYIPYAVYPYYDIGYEPPSGSLEGAGTFDRPQPRDADQEPPGPTIFERRSRSDRRDERDSRYGEHYLDRRDEDRREMAAVEPPPPAAPATDVPETLLVFRDGRRVEIRNYAIMGNTLFVLSGEYRKIPLSEIDLEATARENDDRGVGFRVPGRSE